MIPFGNRRLRRRLQIFKLVKINFNRYESVTCVILHPDFRFVKFCCDAISTGTLFGHNQALDKFIKLWYNTQDK